MDVFKTKLCAPDHISITEENYTRATNGGAPFVVSGLDGSPHYYAICPECDNPIQIVGLYKSTIDSRRPYGRHCKSDIQGVALYDQDEYEQCPYSNPEWKRASGKRANNSPKGHALRKLMREQFDRIVYIWNQTVPIYMSPSLAKETLETWVRTEGWRNYNASYGNLAYNLMLDHAAIKLTYRLVDKKSGLAEALLETGLVDLTPYKGKYLRIEPKNAGFVRLQAALGIHKPKTDGTNQEETFTLLVSNGRSLIYEEKIVVQQDFLYKLIAAGNESMRNSTLLEIAANILTSV